MKLQRKPDSYTTILRENRAYFRSLGLRTPMPFASTRRIKKAIDKILNGEQITGRIELRVLKDYLLMQFDDAEWAALQAN